MKKTGISLLVTAVYAAVVYYVASPALSIHAGGFWALLISTLAVFTLLEAMGVSIQRRKTSIPLQLSSLLILISLAVFLLGALTRPVGGAYMLLSTHARRPAAGGSTGSSRRTARRGSCSTATRGRWTR